MMEYYDVGTDLKELWGDYSSYFVDANLSQDVLMCKDDDWIMGSKSSSSSSSSSSCGGGVVLRDRLMTDAALGGPKPIKSEHSYSMLACSPPRSSPSSTSSTAHIDNCGGPAVIVQKIKQTSHHPIVCSSSETSRLDVTDMEEECFPAISMTTASGGRDSSRSTPEPFHSTTECNVRHENDDEDDTPDEDENNTTVCAIIKGEPLSAPGSPCNATMLLDEERNTMAISPHSIHLTAFATGSHTSDSEEDEDELPMEFKVEDYHVTECEDDVVDHHQTSNSQELPPTPPSSASSDSEGTVSASCSPERRDSHGSVHAQNLRGFLPPRLYVTTSGTIAQHATSTRQPIHTPLISCQPKGSTGILVLTEEEKRTLIAEGYPVPTKLPLTKQEEKSLKKVRRKIKNKISAQESRRKKKEYMDGLERRVTLLSTENSSYREKLTKLETQNYTLMKELQRLQAIIQRK